jgi:hypothetical protein
MLENIGYPFSVLLIGFLAPDSLQVFGVSQNEVTGFFQNVPYWMPIFSGGLHANIVAIVGQKPRG